ncbi:phosphotransferase [Paenibacillus amylolyticus]|jgi:homoserine kinase type II|uniref:Phosphotransferase n=1 Tax=Paenibacillus amylolyticus TaxID=1451 RepID=A0A5M9WSE0_PAEAM|nr:phosphotransferase [Paenibacillus amylolyticus]
MMKEFVQIIITEEFESVSNKQQNSLLPTEKQLISEVLALYGFRSEWQGKRSNGGMNNSTFVLHTSDEDYVMRQYETHNDQAKIAFEHGVLTALSNTDFELHSPTPVISLSSSSREDADQEFKESNHSNEENRQTYQIVRDHITGTFKIVTLFRYLKGVNPVWDSPDQLLPLGRAAGHLSTALAKLKLELEPVYPPYYRIDEAYPLCTPERLLRMCASPPETLEACTDELRQLQDELPGLFKALRGMEQLPHQIVHGDVNASNVLVDPEGNMSAILDFEFATWDLRVMELAVPMSDMLTMDKSEEWMWQAQANLVQGFREEVELTADELEAIPQLILLRSLDVVMHFISRMLEGTDKPEVAAGQIVKLKQRMDWMQRNEEQLRQLLMK